ncbi:MAG: hypothetical protein ACTS7E_04660 [Arsenophonus sp. NC-CH8-MAG3]
MNSSNGSGILIGTTVEDEIEAILNIPSLWLSDAIVFKGYFSPRIYKTGVLTILRLKYLKFRDCSGKNMLQQLVAALYEVRKIGEELLPYLSM